MNIRIKVLNFATKCHVGQFRKNSKEPYITHPIQVAQNAERLLRHYLGADVSEHLIDIIVCIAFLHDVIEDCKGVTRSMIEAELVEYPEHKVKTILDAVVILTKTEKTESYLSYLRGVYLDVFAAIVKLADLEHNLSDLSKGGLRDKYLLAQEYLKSRLDKLFKNEAYQTLYP